MVFRAASYVFIMDKMASKPDLPHIVANMQPVVGPPDSTQFY